ncbi:uncharacterized protein LOC127103747 [Lathyrus oleraceus]|uniref:uncharacterized protein LOC127103747 n=1 Tax=Pisum sativum TaxID=3888 RepID=UPI0021D33639|nr:uncharacterized protein LOC127103747 [Pisum sativum]
MVEFDNRRRLMSRVDELKTPLIEIKNVLMKNNSFPVYNVDYEHCLINPQQCITLKSVIQRLMDHGILVVDCSSTTEEVSTLEILYDEVLPMQIRYDLSPMNLSGSPIVPLVITIPMSFPFNDTKAVPWVYDSTLYIHGQRVQEDPMASNEPMASIADTGGVTRSGRTFAPVPPQIDNGGTSNQEKGNQIEVDQQRKDSLPTSKVDEFLRIIKRRNYRVVNQLNQTPSKISIMSLLMCSDAHRDALVKFSRDAHKPQEIFVYQFEGVVINIAANMSLGFNDEELPVEVRNYNKALHSSMECVDTVLSRFLVDTGSSLNVFLESFLSKLTIDGLLMKPIELVVRAFDGSRRTVIGEVEFTIKIGPHTFFITFYVMDIYPAYSCLLGRPWIHSVGVITSNLHQRLKFLVNSKLVVVKGEEDIMVCNLTSFRDEKTTKQAVVEGSGGLFPTCRESKDEVNLFLGNAGTAMRPLTAALVAAAEGDASSASYFLAGAEVTVGTITVIGCGTSSLQGDVKFAEVLEGWELKLRGQKTASQLPGLHEILLVGKCCKALISI